METKEDIHLNLLSTFHYIVGGIGVFFACFPLIHLSIGVAMLTGSIPLGTSLDNSNQPPEWFGMIFAMMGGLFFLLGQATAWCTIYSAKCLKQRKKHTYSFIIACILCMFVPFGTILGIFSIITLNKSEVKDLYEKTSL